MVRGFWLFRSGLAGVFLLACIFSSSAIAQCSTTAWSSVTGSPAALGSDTSPLGKKYEQSCGLTVDAADGVSFVTTSAPVDEGSFSARFYLLTEALQIGSGGEVTVLSARNVGNVQFQLRLRSTGSVIHLVSYYQDDGSLVQHPDVLPLQDVWQAVEVSWSAGSGNGTFQLEIDDIPMTSNTSLNNPGAVINDVDVGIVALNLASGELVLDAIELRRAGESGLLAVTELENISTRADVGTVDEIVIGGFVITGDTDKCVVIRARGQSVGVPEGEIRLPDPWLVLKLGSETVDINYDWVESPEAATIQNLGLDPPFDNEAAIYACLPPGPYTALVRGQGGSTGIGIVEVFDADQGTPYLENISTRAPVDAGAKVAIGGFIISGDQPKDILIRGRGPSVGVPEGVQRLANPQVRLADAQGDTIISNGDWQNAANAAEISATGLAPPDPSEAAVLVSLDPGLYTAIVSGGGTTGVGIVEVFDLSGGVVAPQ